MLNSILSKKTNLSPKCIIILVCLFAILARILFWQEAIKTPLTHFHLVPGLDMETILKMSEWGRCSIFSPALIWPRLINFTVWYFNGSHNVMILFAIQSSVGIILAAGLSECMLTITGNRYISLATGITSACYGPLIFYEFTTLQESINTFSIFLTFWSWLHFVYRKKNSKNVVFYGILIGIGSIGRPVIVLPVLLLFIINIYLQKRKLISGTDNYKLFCSVIICWLTISIINYFLNGNLSPWYSTKHVFVSASHTVSMQAGNWFLKFLKTLPQYIKNFFMLFTLYEIPENLNYHFFISKLPVLKLLLGPTCLILSVFFSIIVIIEKNEIKPAILGVFVFLTGLGISLSVRIPVSRYRLMLVPYFILISWYGYYLVLKNHSNSKTIWTIICLFFIGILAPQWRLSRLDDNFAYAVAEKQKFGYISEETLLQVFQAWQKSLKTKYLLLCVKEKYEQGDYASAKNMLKYAKKIDNKKSDLISYLSGVIAYEEKDFQTLQKCLEQVKKVDNLKEFKAKYFLFYGELLRYQQNFEQAIVMYKKSLKFADNDKELIDYITAILQFIRKY